VVWNFGLRKKMNMPSGLWMRCDGCGEMIYKKEVQERLNTCPKCNFHFRISSRERIRITLDSGSFDELFTDLRPVDHLGFKALKSYSEKLDKAREATGLTDASVAGLGTIGGFDVVFLVTDPAFIQGSVGVCVGEKIARAAEKAREFGIPLVVVSGSGGGARMEEGVLSLMQLAKTSAALGRLSDAGILYAVLLTNATMGGAMASWASLGDITVAEPKALIGFTGPRVIQQTVKTELPKGFQTSEFLLERGFIDAIVPRPDLRDYLKCILSYCGEAGTSASKKALAEFRAARPPVS
jgi:acetyl-CoA carboxylase carboxyl transferase subunit beta